MSNAIIGQQRAAVRTGSGSLNRIAVVDSDLWHEDRKLGQRIGSIGLEVVSGQVLDSGDRERGGHSRNRIDPFDEDQSVGKRVGIYA